MLKELTLLLCLQTNSAPALMDNDTIQKSQEQKYNQVSLDTPGPTSGIHGTGILLPNHRQGKRSETRMCLKMSQGPLNCNITQRITFTTGTNRNIKAERLRQVHFESFPTIYFWQWWQFKNSTNCTYKSDITCPLLVVWQLWHLSLCGDSHTSQDSFS